MKMGDEPIHPIEGAANAYSFSGITLRQYYAGLAMQAIMSRDIGAEFNSKNSKLVSKAAVQIADALLAELEKQNEA